MPKGKDVWIDEKDEAKRRAVIIYSIAAFVLVFASIFLVRLWLSSTERNVWLCQNGEWVQVGHPTGPPPSQGCSTDSEALNWRGSGGEDGPTVPKEAQFFTESGHLVKGLPKFNPGYLYFAYDRLGVGTETVRLIFIEDSVCTAGDRIISCRDALLQHGVKVKVRGEKYLDKLWVVTLDVEQQR